MINLQEKRIGLPLALRLLLSLRLTVLIVIVELRFKYDLLQGLLFHLVVHGPAEQVRYFAGLLVVVALGASSSLLRPANASNGCVTRRVQKKSGLGRRRTFNIPDEVPRGSLDMIGLVEDNLVRLPMRIVGVHRERIVVPPVRLGLPLAEFDARVHVVVRQDGL